MTVTSTRSMAALKLWHETYTETALEPALPIIDAHHHMWDRPPERYALDELLSDFSCGHNIRASVFVECTAMFRADGPEALKPVGETEYVNGVAAASASGIYGPARLCAGIVSYADLTAGDAVRPLLEAHIRAGGERFRGIRQQAQHDPVLGSMARRAPPPGLLLNSEFRAGFAALAPLSLSFDAYLYCTQLGELLDLAKTFPETRIILNHAGTPLGIGPYAVQRQEVFNAWSESLRRLAECENVVLKIGGLGMALCGFGLHARVLPPSSDDLAELWRPYVDVCIASFGAARCMFESNFPVDKQSCGYSVLWNAFKKLSETRSPEERTDLFSGTARRVYRIDV
jgi:predicted TIM-barrel fold metal-dependent hydrolase